MPKLPVDSPLVHVLLRSVLGALRGLPLRVAVRLARRVGGGVYRIDGRHRRIADVNLTIAFPHWTPAERSRVARESFRNAGEHAALFAHLPRLTDPPRLSRLIRYEGLEHYQAARRDGGPVLFLAAHLGFWELMAFGHGILTRPVHFIVRTLDQARLDEMVNRVRSLPGNRPIPKQGSLRRVLRLLAAGQDVGVLIDQNVQAREGVFVDFLGKPACMTPSLALLAQRSEARVVPSFLFPDPEHPGGYCLHFLAEVPVSRGGDTDADAWTNTARFAEVLGGAVRRWPAFWLWGHKRWKTRPPDDPDDPYAGI